MTRHTPSTPRRCRPRVIAAASALLAMAGVHAIEIDTGDRQLNVRWDNTVRYNLGVRAERQDSRITNSLNYDESDLKFGRGDVMTNRLDLLSEFDVRYKGRVGGRVSAAAWYDQAYDDTSVQAHAGFPTSYNGDVYNSRAKRYSRGPSGELLDAFVWANLDLGPVPMAVKLGRHTNYWGEAALPSNHALAYSQAPLDGTKAATSPGIELKELFLPLGQLSFKAQLNSYLSVAGQYFYEWKSTRVPYGGTYFGVADFFDADRLAVATPGGILSVPAAPELRPSNRGNWGINARYNLEAIESTIGVYYREFDDYNPQVQVAFPTFYRRVYTNNVRQTSVSFARVTFGWTTGAELSYRQGGALTSTTTLADGGARGNTWHSVINGATLLPKTALFDTGSLLVEAAFNHLEKVTGNNALYKGESATCTKAIGCATRNFVNLAANVNFQWLQVLPSWDFSLPVSFSRGVYGNAATNSGGNQGAGTWSIGVGATYEQRHDFTLKYADSFTHANYVTSSSGVTSIASSNGSSVGVTDRGWIGFTYKVGF